MCHADAGHAPRIITSTDRLASYPEYGHRAPWDATGRLRELVVAGTPFVILYTIGPESIIVVRLLHGAQRHGL